MNKRSDNYMMYSLFILMMGCLCLVGVVFKKLIREENTKDLMIDECRSTGKPAWECYGIIRGRDQ